MTGSPDIETAVIGGGVIGLAIAAACAKSGQETVVFERRSAVGQEVSSRSSEVIHRGLYYPNGSLKAKFCVEGHRRIYQFAQENGVPTKRVGKLIVAASPAQIPTLKGIHALAQSNGVDDLEWLEQVEAHALEPAISCAAALYSPSTGIMDSHSFMQALEGHLLARGGTVVLNSELQSVEHAPHENFKLGISTGKEAAFVTARNLFVAAGLGMAQLGPMLPREGTYSPPTLHFAKGHYFGLQGRVPFQHLVYPVPVDGGLGTHLTLDLQGRARFGPDVLWTDHIDYAFRDPEERIRCDFEMAIRQYWPGLPDGALRAGDTGIRPKISGKGQPAGDFEIHGAKHHGIERMVALYGIESPGLTSSLAIADHSMKLCLN